MNNLNKSMELKGFVASDKITRKTLFNKGNGEKILYINTVLNMSETDQETGEKTYENWNVTIAGKTSKAWIEKGIGEGSLVRLKGVPQLKAYKDNEGKTRRAFNLRVLQFEEINYNKKPKAEETKAPQSNEGIDFSQASEEELLAALSAS